MASVDASETSPRRVGGAVLGVTFAVANFQTPFATLFNAEPVPDATDGTQITLHADSFGEATTFTFFGSFAPPPDDPIELRRWFSDFALESVQAVRLAILPAGEGPVPSVVDLDLGAPQTVNALLFQSVDQILGAADTILGSPFADSLGGWGGADTMQGGEGHDSLDGGDGPDSLLGEGGNDTLVGGFGADLLNGGVDDDSLLGGLDDDRLVGGAGDDTLEGQSGADRAQGGAGGDLLDGGDDDDRLNGGGGGDVLLGGSGDDTLAGGAGGDALEGGENDDRLLGGGGGDTLAGGFGDDVLSGGGGSDLILGGDGFDMLEGGGGHDTLANGPDDRLVDAPDDTLSGGKGRDLLIVNLPDLPLGGGPVRRKLRPAADDTECDALIQALGGSGADTLRLVADRITSVGVAIAGDRIEMAYQVGSLAPKVACIETRSVERIEVGVLGRELIGGWEASGRTRFAWDADAGGFVGTEADGRVTVFAPEAGVDAPGEAVFGIRGTGRDMVDLRGATWDSLVLVATDGGRDTLIGGRAGEGFAAGAANDRVRAGRGDDAISDGPGKDRLTGDGGADRFVLEDDDTRDTITDFDPRAGDTVSIEGAEGLDDLRLEDLRSGALAVRFGGDTAILLDPDGRLSAAEAEPGWFGF